MDELSPFTHCGHGRKYVGEHCLECEIVWAEEGVQFALRDLERWSGHLAKLREARSTKGEEA